MTLSHSNENENQLDDDEKKGTNKNKTFTCVYVRACLCMTGPKNELKKKYYQQQYERQHYGKEYRKLQTVAMFTHIHNLPSPISILFSLFLGEYRLIPSFHSSYPDVLSTR